MYKYTCSTGIILPMQVLSHPTNSVTISFLISNFIFLFKTLKKEFVVCYILF